MARTIEHLHFYRYEFKYLLSPSQLSVVTPLFDKHLSRDIHSSAQGDYTIRSIYFDSPDLRWYHEKRNGLLKRFKYRLRTYSHYDSGFSDPLYLELKGRDGSLVIKHRLRLPIDFFSMGIPGGAGWFRDLLCDFASDDRVAERFVAQSYRYHLAPSVITDYHRSAWEDPANPDFRATVDTLSTGWRTLWKGLPEGIPVQLLPRYAAVLEIKFKYRIPFWFQRVLRELNMERVSYSKFQTAVELLYLDHAGSRLNRLIERRAACLH